MARRAVARVLAVALPGQALAHPGVPPEPHDVWEAWTLEPGVVLPLVLGAGLYARGVRRLWTRAGPGRGVQRWQAGAFAAGLGALVVALVSPLHRLGEALFSAHMAQHTVLLLVASPLLVLGQPRVAFLWALPARWRLEVGGWARSAPVRAGWRALSGPVAAWLVHAVAVWVWHAPALYQATLRDEAVHALQHACFLGSGLLFWHVAERARPRGRLAGAAGLYVFTTAVQESLLGALLTFSPVPLYPAYGGRTEAWGLSLLEDQQLGGLLMWVPGGVVYLVAALALFHHWLRSLEARAEPGWRPVERAGRGPVR